MVTGKTHGQNVAVRLFISVVVLFWSAVCAFGAAADEITFQLLRGRAALSRNGGGTWLDLGPEPVSVKIQDMLRTEAETRAELKFPDGSLFRVKSNSRLTLLNDGIQLQVGESWFNLKKQGRTFQVVTPTTVCGVLGTTFDVNVDRFGRTQVRVFDGLVSVKAHGDRRKRQLVLQRGMMTSIRDRENTGEQIQKFDPSGEDARIQNEWKNLAPMKLGPERPNLPQGLPPMRQSSSGEWKPVFKQGDQSDSGNVSPGEEKNGKAEKADQASTGIRGNVDFFQKMQEQRMHVQRPDEADEAARNALLPIQTGAAAAVSIDAEKMKQGIGARFGQAGSGPVGASDQRTLREEYLRTQNQLLLVQDQLKQTLSELEELRKKLNARATAQTGSGMTATQVKERMTVLIARLKSLREQQSKLLQRLDNLRNRLR